MGELLTIGMWKRRSCMKFQFPDFFENVLLRRVLSSRFVEAVQPLVLELIFTFRREIKFKRRVRTKNNDADERSDEGVMTVCLPVKVCFWDRQLTYLVRNVMSSLITYV